MTPRRGVIVGLILAAQTTANVGPIGIPAIASLIRSDLGLTLTQAGSFLSAYYIGPVLMSFPAGTMADQWGIGRTLILDGRPFPIVGVTPASFFGVEVGWAYDVALPLCAEAALRGVRSALDKRDHWWLAAMGRLAPGSSLEKTSARLQTESRGIFEDTLAPSYNAEDAKNYLAFKLGAFPAGSGLSRLRSRYEAIYLGVKVTKAEALKEGIRVTFEGNYNTSPSWSPSGDRLAYTSRVGGRFQVFTVKTDGSDVVQLKASAGDNEDPSWSPDGRYVVFSSSRSGVARLYLSDRSGTTQLELTGGKGGDTSPSWSRWRD